MVLTPSREGKFAADYFRVKKSLAALRAEQKELQTAAANIDSILNEARTKKKGKRRSGPELQTAT